MSTTHTRQPRVPRAAQRLRLPVWERSQARMRERHGFDLAAPDMLARIRSLVDERPDDPERILLLAAALSLSGDDDLALARARRAAELAPALARAQTTLAALLLGAGDRDGALEHARRAGALDAADPSVQYNLGLAEWVVGERSAASAAFERASAALGAAEPAPQGPQRWWRRRRG